jgi:HEAT repeat protein
MDALAETDRSDELQAILADEEAHEEMRVLAAWALGEQRGSLPLMSSSVVENARVREAVMSGLGHCHGDEVTKHLVQAVRRDAQADVVAAALRGLASVDPDQALKMARARMNIRDRERLEIRNAAIDVLGEHGEAQDLGLLLDGRAPMRLRHGALWAAVSLVKRVEEEQIRSDLSSQVSRFAETLLEDDDLRARSTAIQILSRVGDEQSIPVLEAFRRRSSVIRLRDSAAHALFEIRSRDGAAPALSPNEMEDMLKAMEERLEALEAENKNWESRH